MRARIGETETKRKGNHSFGEYASSIYIIKRSSISASGVREESQGNMGILFGGLYTALFFRHFFFLHFLGGAKAVAWKV